jgi:hypothetical protein
MHDFAAEAMKDLGQVHSLSDFCKEWKSSWRGIAVSVQGILNLFFPAGAKVVGFLISIADTYCATPQSN